MRITRVFVGVVPIIMATGCGSSTDVTSSPAVSTSEGIEAFLAELGSPGDSYLVETPQALADRAQFVVRGRLTGLREGREVRLSEEASLWTVTFEVTPTEYLKGTPDGAVDDVLYVEYPSHAPGDAARLEKSFPVGTEVQAYLSPSSDRTTNPRLVDEFAGRPEGQPLWTAWLSPGGLAFEGARGSVVVNGEYWSNRGLSLDEFAPDRKAWPRIEVGETGGDH